MLALLLGLPTQAFAIKVWQTAMYYDAAAATATCNTTDASSNLGVPSTQAPYYTGTGTWSTTNSLYINWYTTSNSTTPAWRNALNALGFNLNVAGTGPAPQGGAGAVSMSYTFDSTDAGTYALTYGSGPFGAIDDGKKIYIQRANGSFTSIYCATDFSSQPPNPSVPYTFAPGDTLVLWIDESGIGNNGVNGFQLVPFGITVAKSVSANPLTIGGTGQKYTIAITVTATATTSPLQISDLLPTGITVGGAITTSQGTLTGCPVTGATSLNGCTLAAGLPVGTTNITVPINVGSTATSGTNTASVAGGGSTCTTQTPCSGTTPPVSVNPHLVVSKTVSANPLMIGASGQFYTITINVQNDPTTAPIVLADTLPAGITTSGAITATGGTLNSCPAAGATNINACRIASGTNGPVIITVPINVGSATTGNNTASVTGGGAAGCTSTTPCAGSVTVPIAPTLSVKKIRSSSTPASASYSFTFNGDNGYGSQSISTTADGTSTATAPVNLTTVGAVTTLTEAPVEGYKTTAISCTGVAAANYATNLTTSSVKLNATATAGGINNVCTFTNTAVPVLNVSKSVSPPAATVGSTLTYTISVRNSGATTAATTTTIREVIPSGITVTNVVAQTGWQCTSTPSTGSIIGSGTTATMVECSPTSALVPSATSAPAVVLTALKTGAGSITNTAVVQKGGGDNVCASASAPAAGAPARCSSSATVTEGLTDLGVIKDDGKTVTQTGANNVYRLRVTNLSLVPAIGATLTDPAAAGLTKTTISCSAIPSQCTTAATPTVAQLEAGFVLPTLAGGAFYELTVTTVVTATSGSVTNSASVASTSTMIDSNPANNNASDTDSVSVPLTVNKSVSVQSDPINGVSTNAKAIPGAFVDYSIGVSNTNVFAVDANSIMVTDHIPDHLALYVADLTGAGTGPVQFTDGSPSSTLSFSYVSLASPSDSIDFSNDGGVTWAYVPTPGSDGTDPVVTDIRYRPSGPMAANSSFSIRFRCGLR